VRIVVKRGENTYKLYIRLWSNAANFIVTDENGAILDAMRRLPKKGEVTGGTYQPENIPAKDKPGREFEIRELPGEGSFNKKLDDYYAAQGGSLSLEALREQARRTCEGSIGRISAALERLREKEASFEDAARLKNYGDIILSNIASIKPDDKWLEAHDTESGAVTRIELTPRTKPAAMAEKYYEQYRKAKKGLSEIQKEIAEGEKELQEVAEKLNRLLEETNPLVLAKMLSKGQLVKAGSAARTEKK
jgi:predicted ribosome quality control (RQC) complex YloA/Tae2 family protein